MSLPKYYQGRIQLDESNGVGDLVRVLFLAGAYIEVEYSTIERFTGAEFEGKSIAFMVERLVDGPDRVIDCLPVDELEPVGLGVYMQRIPTLGDEAKPDPEANDQVVVDRQKHESKVVTLDGEELKHPEPNQALIDLLSYMLSEARSGELQSLVYAGQYHDMKHCRGAAGKVKDRYGMYGAAQSQVNEFYEHNIRT